MSSCKVHRCTTSILTNPFNCAWFTVNSHSYSYWNFHRNRYQKEKLLPSSIVPAQLIEALETFGGTNCLIPVHSVAVQEMRKVITEDMEDVENRLAWVSATDFDRAAASAHKRLGPPDITLETSWTVYAELVKCFNETL